MIGCCTVLWVFTERLVCCCTGAVVVHSPRLFTFRCVFQLLSCASCVSSHRCHPTVGFLSSSRDSVRSTHLLTVPSARHQFHVVSVRPSVLLFQIPECLGVLHYCGSVVVVNYVMVWMELSVCCYMNLLGFIWNLLRC